MFCRKLQEHYPNFPFEQEFKKSLFNEGDLIKHSEGGSLWLLSRFATQWQILQAGGALLPDLVEFYNWLDSNLAHVVTYDHAWSSISQVIDQTLIKLSKKSGDHIRNLYNEVKKKYNRYVTLIGGAIGAGACAAVRRGNKIFTISDEIPLIHFLTGTYLHY